MQCQHLGEPTGTVVDAEPERACGHPDHATTTPGGCLSCPDWAKGPESSDEGQQERPSAVASHHPSPLVPRHPQGLIVNRAGASVDLSDLWRGASAFCVLGGPSLKEMDLSPLARRGVLIISTNNCPAALPAGVRPHVWIHTDPTHKFHDSLWRDPSILKFSPVKEWEGASSAAWPPEDGRRPRRKAKGLRQRVGDRLEFRPGVSAASLPGVLGYHRNTCFDPDGWLWEPTINRGNDKASSHGGGGRTGNGWPHVINTMFAVLRLAFYLGVSRLYLLGADFRMRDESPYAFGQGKHPGGVSSNNGSYANMLTMLDALQPRFLAAGFHVLNATPASNLWTFPVIGFAAAVEEATGDIEQELDCREYYDDWNTHRAAHAG